MRISDWSSDVCASDLSRRSLARQSLGAILKPSSLSRGDLDRCQSTAAAFVRAWRYRNATDQCLVRSIAMRAMLARRGLGSDLVIGVMLPFSAHFWLPVGRSEERRVGKECVS